MQENFFERAFDEFAMWRMRLYSVWFDRPYRINKSGIAPAVHPKSLIPYDEVNDL